ncbi:MAG: NAD(P)/FAD-dependent oxidoreductase, partial [Candidatus Binatia bacterium]
MHVAIVGGGFGGLYAARTLRGAPAKVRIIDKRNFHLFQPLLYQVATGELAVGDIAYPLREVFKRDANFYVMSTEVVDLDPDQKKIFFCDGELRYDTLVLATGSSHHYFGHEQWAEWAPGLK